MAGLLMVNPQKRRKPRTAKQKAATRKIKAANKRSKKPVKRGSSTSRTVTVTRKRNPIRRTKSGIVPQAIETLKDGAIGSVGAISASVIGSYLPIPSSMKTGAQKIGVDALLAIGTGFVVSKYVDKKVGQKMAQGGVTVALHSAMKAQLSGMIPSLNLGEYDDGLLAYDDFDDELDAYDMSAFVGEDTSFGYAGAGNTGSGNAFDDDESDIDIDEFS